MTRHENKEHVYSGRDKVRSNDDNPAGSFVMQSQRMREFNKLLEAFEEAMKAAPDHGIYIDGGQRAKALSDLCEARAELRRFVRMIK